MPSWDEPKRRRNLRLHGLDFRGGEPIWEHFTVTREDTRKPYGEPRWVTFGWLRGEVVVLVHTERDDDFHCISLRKAEKYETRYYLEASQKHQPGGC